MKEGTPLPIIFSSPPPLPISVNPDFRNGISHGLLFFSYQTCTSSFCKRDWHVLILFLRLLPQCVGDRTALALASWADVGGRGGTAVASSRRADTLHSLCTRPSAPASRHDNAALDASSALRARS